MIQSFDAILLWTVFSSEVSFGIFLALLGLTVMIQCSKCLSKELTLVLSDTRELDRVHSTK